MKKLIIVLFSLALLTGTALAADREIAITITPEPAVIGQNVRFICEATGTWKNDRVNQARISIWDASSKFIVKRAAMSVSGKTATYDYTIDTSEDAGIWQIECQVTDGRNRESAIRFFSVAAPGDEDADRDGYTAADGDCNDNDASIYPGAAEVCGDGIDQDCSGDDLACDPGTGTGHLSIQSYEGPATCIACHPEAAGEMLASVHMKWAGPTPELSNTDGGERGKAMAGINTFCTYAMSSKGACFSCHVRSDGNAPHPPDENDVDCLMCHNDTYQRKFVPDPANTETVTNVLGETKTYVFGKVDAAGNYLTEPDFSKMPEGTTMVDIAQNVHLPTRQSCLRCHAKAGGGDWTKRGDMGLSSANPSLAEDVHMSPDGGDLSCADCHSGGNHLIGGRGIDLRATEAPDPECSTCHTAAPHLNSTLNRHAAGQASCQLCHIREFGKGGATEMSRDWTQPHWNPAFCNGQGGFVGHEAKFSNVKPEYRWFDGTSYVYNIDETIEPNPDGTYTMAKANGAPFDGYSKIYPIKNHWTNMPLHESGQIVPPTIMQMFMTGDFDQAVQKGMNEQGMTGSYTMIHANAEMLITHGVAPKSDAPACNSCHDGSGRSALSLPFAELGFHTFPAQVADCTLCHEQKKLGWETMHNKHIRSEDGLDCTMCHTSPPTGLVQPINDLCRHCHSYRQPEDLKKVHRAHSEQGYLCTKCHQF